MLRHLFLPAILFLAHGCSTPPPKPPATTPAPAAKPALKPAAKSPRWQAVPAVADGAAVPGGRRHIVKRGETGIAIAKAYGVPWSRIAAANRMRADSILEIGQPLFIPTGPPAGTAKPATPGPAGTPEQQAAAFTLDVDDLITGSSQAQPAGTPSARPPTPATPPRPAGSASIPALAWPVDGRVILSRFGPKAGGRVNDGINIKALSGQPVRAAADGQILYVGDAIAGFGLMILIRHPGGSVTAYGHLEDALADRGQKVSRGQLIARAGSSGDVKEPQLLFQLRLGRKPVDPLLHLPR